MSEAAIRKAEEAAGRLKTKFAFDARKKLIACGWEQDEQARAGVMRPLLDMGLRAAGLEDKDAELPLRVFRVTRSGPSGFWHAGSGTLGIRLDIWMDINRYARYGEDMDLEELRSAKNGFQTLLHESLHALGLTCSCGAQGAAFEEGLTEYIALGSTNRFLQALELDRINPRISAAPAFDGYPEQTRLVRGLLERICESECQRMDLAISAHRLRDWVAAVDYLFTALGEAARGGPECRAGDIILERKECFLVALRDSWDHCRGFDKVTDVLYSTVNS